MISNGHAAGTQTGSRRFTATLVVALCLVGLARAQTSGPDSSPRLADSSPPPDEAPAVDRPQVIVPDSGPAPGPPQDCFWASADYLLGWVRGSRLPPLVTTSPAGTPQAAAGVLGQPGTTVLFGNSLAADDLRSGVRLDLGAWLNADHTVSIDASFFLLESEAELFSAASPAGTPILARPYLDAATHAAASQLVAFPGLAAGSVTGSFRNDNFLGATIDLHGLVLCCDRFRLDSIIGYRWLQFNDRLAMDTSETATGGVLAAGTRIETSDRFSASNVFHGGDFGLKTAYAGDRWSLALYAKLAVGLIHRSVGILGATQRTVPGTAPAEFDAGFLALSSNSGVFDSYDWVVAPEFGVVLGWDLARNLRLNAGYDFLLLSNVARPADQVNLNLNPALFPPAQAGASPASPTFKLHKSDIWAQTLSLGLEYRF